MKRRRPQLGGRASLALLAVLLSACTVIGHEQVPGWPALEVVEHYVPEAQMRERCVKYVAFGMSPQACAEFDFARKRCDLWFSADFPPTRAMVEHERLHCRGFDHIGMGTMAGILARYGGADSASAGGTRK
jgi:hypothetical protein